MTVQEFCEENNIFSYTIDEEGLINTRFGVFLSHKGLEKLPFKFGTVIGGFNINNNNLTSMEGFPKKIINGSLAASDNKITSLKGCPVEIDGDLHVSNNDLTDLEFFPEKVRCVYLGNNKLTSLKGCPKVIDGDFILTNNLSLTSFKYGPEIVYGDYSAIDCNIQTLEYLPKSIKSKSLNIYGNPIYTLTTSAFFEDLVLFKESRVVKKNVILIKRFKYYLNILKKTYLIDIILRDVIKENIYTTKD